MQNFRTYQMAKEFFLEGKKLKLRGASKDQFDRASLSIALNLMEGSGKSGIKDRRRFFLIAFGSARECLGILDLNALSTQKIDRLCGMIYRLVQNPGLGPPL